MLDICIKNVDTWQYYSYRKQARLPPVPSSTLYASITDGYEKTLETSHLAREYCFVFPAVGNDCPTLTPFFDSLEILVIPKLKQKNPWRGMDGRR